MSAQRSARWCAGQLCALRRSSTLAVEQCSTLALLAVWLLRLLPMQHGRSGGPLGGLSYCRRAALCRTHLALCRTYLALAALIWLCASLIWLCAALVWLCASLTCLPMTLPPRCSILPYAGLKFFTYQHLKQWYHHSRPREVRSPARVHQHECCGCCSAHGMPARAAVRMCQAPLPCCLAPR